MIALIQRVSHAQVEVDGSVAASIDIGVLAFIGVEPHDTEESSARLVQRIVNYRLFADAKGKMNASLKDVCGGLLLVPQFTLAADTNKGNRPSFSTAAAPEAGRQRFQEVVHLARSETNNVACGIFGADMRVSLINEGPVTFWLSV
jgi:D-tyrosyl-tRNA(Tyr) deacylase